MLRLGYMASDFHPKLLVLGEQAELGRVAELLSKFSDSGSEVRLVRDCVMQAASTEVVIREPERDAQLGLSAANADAANVHLIWRLTRDRAAEFSDEIEALVNSGVSSGSVNLECGNLDEIKVVVSFGEWDDDFLVN